jgi:mannosyltransferase OCH1-like enzyme
VSVPKILHYIWLGDKPMHPLMIQWREQWKRLHPSWEIRMWAEGKNIGELASGTQILKSRHPRLLEQCCHLSQRSNVWRYDLVEQLGGVYLDTDFQPVKNIDAIVDPWPAFAGKAWVNHVDGLRLETACSLFGAVAHHPWVQDLNDHVEDKDPRENCSMGFGYFCEITTLHPEVHLFDPDIFYPVRFDQPGMYPTQLPGSTCAVHRWASKWFPNARKPLPQPEK